MAYKQNLLFHIKKVNELLPRFDAESSLNLKNLVLEVRGRSRCFQLVPQFLFLDDKRRIHYTHQLLSRVRGFIGWLPYSIKQWPIATDKLAFKEYCIAHGLRTPAYRSRAADSVRNFIVKHRAWGFGYGIRGPFETIAAGNPRTRLSDKEFYEEFVHGDIAKIWYWNDRPIGLELRPMPTVCGDGSRPLYDLVVAATVRPNVPPDRGDIADLARHQGFSLDEPVPAGTTVLADFRYGSGLFPPNPFKNANVLAGHLKGDTGRQLLDAGPVFWRSVPRELRDCTLYTVDAIVDGRAQVWFLELNCNPMGHPDVYFPMFESLFGPANPVMPAWPGSGVATEAGIPGATPKAIRLD